jgi:hypothetical protein
MGRPEVSVVLTWDDRRSSASDSSEEEESESSFEGVKVEWEGSLGRGRGV